MSNEEILLAVGSRLSRLRAVRRAVAFGSRASGTPLADSDLDIMIVADLRGSLAERSLIIRKQLLDIPVPMDIVIYTPEEYERLSRWRTSIAAIAEKSGRVLCG